MSSPRPLVRRSCTCSPKNCTSSITAFLRPSGSAAAFSRIARTQSVKRSFMLVGTPSMVAMTCAGICWEYSTAMSAVSRPAMRSMSSRHHARVNTSSSSTARGENDGSRARRV